MNGFFDFVERNLADEGLDRLEFESFPLKKLVFDPTILERIARKSSNMHTLVMTKMGYLNDEARGQLTSMVADCISSGNQLEKIDLTNLSSSTTQGYHVLEALVDSNHVNLAHLSLTNNRKWFNNSEKVEMIAHIISN